MRVGKGSENKVKEKLKDGNGIEAKEEEIRMGGERGWISGCKSREVKDVERKI